MGSAYKNKGIQPLLDGVIDYLPDPTQVENFAFSLKEEDKENKEKLKMEINNRKSFVGLAFKLEESKFG